MYNELKLLLGLVSFGIQIFYGENYIFRKVSKDQMMEIFDNYLDNLNFTNTWKKVFDCFPENVNFYILGLRINQIIFDSL